MSTRSPSAPPPARPGLRAAWGRLDHRQRRIGAAALLVLVSMVLPWYSEETATRSGPDSIVRSGGSVSGLAGMSFVEASLLVVLIGIVALLWGRGTGRRFALPFPDGTLICVAAGWMGALIVYRLFAKPHGEDSAQGVTVIGLNWGIFVSLLAVGVLFAAAFDLRRHGGRNAVPGEPEAIPPSPYPDVDPATIVVRSRSGGQPTTRSPIRSDEQPTTRSRVWDDDQPTTRIPTWDDEPTTRIPAQDDEPTAVVPSPRETRPTPLPPTRRDPDGPPPADDQPPRQAPAVPWGSEDRPTAVVPSPPSSRRTPTRPNGDPASPERDEWPSRMRRTPRTPTPRDPGGPNEPSG